MAEKEEIVLVVDDEEPVRSLLQRILQGAGYQTVTAASGKEALNVLSGGKIDVVLLDIKMPEMSGIEVLRKLETRPHDICPIMVTAVIDMDTAVNALKSGAYDYITKPFTQDDVVTKVGSAISKWKLRIQDKHRYQELTKNMLDKTKKMQDQFAELVNSMAREHKLIIQLASKAGEERVAMLSRLPGELREPLATVEEFRDALIKILRKSV